MNSRKQNSSIPPYSFFHRLLENICFFKNCQSDNFTSVLDALPSWCEEEKEDEKEDKEEEEEDEKEDKEDEEDKEGDKDK